MMVLHDYCTSTGSTLVPPKTQYPRKITNPPSARPFPTSLHFSVLPMAGSLRYAFFVTPMVVGTTKATLNAPSHAFARSCRKAASKDRRKETPRIFSGTNTAYR